MRFNILQVLRTRVPLRTPTGKTVPPQTRVVTQGMEGKERVRVRIADPSRPGLDGRLVAGVGAFSRTFRGRPRKMQTA